MDEWLGCSQSEQQPEPESLHRSANGLNCPVRTSSASEMMFFEGASFAHIVAYEDDARMRRKELELRLLKRHGRSLAFSGRDNSSSISSPMPALS